MGQTISEENFEAKQQILFSAWSEVRLEGKKVGHSSVSAVNFLFFFLYEIRSSHLDVEVFALKKNLLLGKLGDH